jgi:RNA polymerase sigma-70 factor (ECF subfamily)
MTGTTYAPGEPADTALVKAARHGDLYAWERLVRRYQEPVYRVAWLVVRDSDLAEAATLSTFVRAYRALPSYDDELGLLPWLIRIAAGESRQQRRETGRPTRSDRPIERQAAPHFPSSTIPGMAEAASLTVHERKAVAEAFDRLGENDRLVIAARYLFGLSREDAASALSIASGLVDERLHGALGRLRTRMAVG